jgi:type I site-specific restriction endonuclease
MLPIELRDYQQECIQAIEDSKESKVLCQLFTGAGKTVIFSHLPRKGRMLVLAHTEELVQQPIKYFDCEVGVEQAANRSNGEEVVTSCVNSMATRLDRFRPDEFDTIIYDECHHAACSMGQKILSHFKPRKLIGFTATPNRADGVGLSGTFEKIIFSRDIRWGMENGWLANLTCKRVYIGYDLCGVRSQGGDYEKGALAQACDIPECVKAVAQAAREIAEPPVLIFAVNIAHAEHIAAELNGVALSGKSKNREEVINAFRAGQIPYLVNCQVLTEGFDAPETKTVLVARPTQSVTLYTQIVGRGLRRTATKDRALLIDCVGASKNRLCTAPSLLGMDTSMVPKHKLAELEGDLFSQLPSLVQQNSDCIESWINNVKIVDVWANDNKIDVHGIMWFLCADGKMILPLPNERWLRITPSNLLGQCRLQHSAGYDSGIIGQQEAMDIAYRMLCKFAQEEKTLWNKKAAQRWGKGNPTEKQRRFIEKEFGIETRGLTRLECSRVIARKMITMIQ